MKTCDFCGRQEADDAKTLTWSTAVENGRSKTLLRAAARASTCAPWRGSSTASTGEHAPTRPRSTASAQAQPQCGCRRYAVSVGGSASSRTLADHVLGRPPSAAVARSCTAQASARARRAGSGRPGRSGLPVATCSTTSAAARVGLAGVGVHAAQAGGGARARRTDRGGVRRAARPPRGAACRRAPSRRAGRGPARPRSTPARRWRRPASTWWPARPRRPDRTRRGRGRRRERPRAPSADRGAGAGPPRRRRPRPARRGPARSARARSSRRAS